MHSLDAAISGSSTGALCVEQHPRVSCAAIIIHISFLVLMHAAQNNEDAFHNLDNGLLMRVRLENFGCLPARE
jgi:hypothetical protein